MMIKKLLLKHSANNSSTLVEGYRVPAAEITLVTIKPNAFQMFFNIN